MSSTSLPEKSERAAPGAAVVASLRPGHDRTKDLGVLRSPRGQEPTGEVRRGRD